MDIQEIIKLYQEERHLFSQRDALNKNIKLIRGKLKRIVSKYYWDSGIELSELEDMFGIPFNQIHLYCESRIFNSNCIICGEQIVREVKSKSDRDSPYFGYTTCSNKCHEVACGINPPIK
jgi:hypothetical protein